MQIGIIKVCVSSELNRENNFEVEWLLNYWFVKKEDFYSN